VKYFVVDTNYLRDADFVLRLQNSTVDEQFVLTDPGKQRLCLARGYFEGSKLKYQLAMNVVAI
jgi:hypothetical protein